MNNKKMLLLIILVLVIFGITFLNSIGYVNDKVVVKNWVGSGVSNVTDVSVTFSNGTTVQLANPSITNPTVFSGLWGQTAKISYSVPWTHSDISETVSLIGCHGTVTLTNTVTIPSIFTYLIR